MNVSDYLGIQYDIHNNSGLNCWGLVASVYNDVFGSDLKDFPSDSDDKRKIAAIFSAAFADGSHGFSQIDSPIDHDVIVFHRDTRFGRLFHCGIMWKGKVLHCSSQAGGVVYQSIAIAGMGFKGVEFWRR